MACFWLLVLCSCAFAVHGFGLEKRNKLIHKYMSEYGEYERGIFHLLAAVIPVGSIIFEVGGRTGDHMSLFYSSPVAPKGIIAWEGNKDFHEEFVSRLTDSMFNKTMLLKHNASSTRVLDSTQENENESNDEGATISLHSIYKTYDTCPDLVKILDGRGALTLTQSRDLIAKCVPTIYVENDCQRSSFSAISMLEELGYTIFWHVSSALPGQRAQQASNDFFIGLLGLYEPDHDTIKSLHVFPLAEYVSGMSYFHDYELVVVYDSATQAYRLRKEDELTTEEKKEAITVSQHPSTDSICVEAARGELPPGPSYSPYSQLRVAVSNLDSLCGEHFSVEFNAYDFVQFENLEERKMLQIIPTEENGTANFVPKAKPVVFKVGIPKCPPGGEGFSKHDLEALFTEWGPLVQAKCKDSLGGIESGLSGIQKSCFQYTMNQLRIRIENRTFRARVDGHEEEEGVDDEDEQEVLDTWTFTTERFGPLATTVSADVPCGDTIWCEHFQHMYLRVLDFQNPGPFPFVRIDRDEPDMWPDDNYVRLSQHRSFSAFSQCQTSKFLVYTIPSESRGIGSLLHLIASMMRYALCHDRILYLMPLDLPISEKRWRAPGCRGSFLDCFFLPLTQCSLSAEEIRNAVTVRDGTGLDMYPWKNSRVVRMVGLPSDGRCALCGARWDGNKDFFDGVYSGEMGYMVGHLADGSLDTWKTAWQRNKYRQLWHIRAMQSDIKGPWQSSMVRYLLRPRPWFSEHLKDTVNSRLVKSKRHGHNNSVSVVRCRKIPAPYVSVHVRFGNKVLETKSKPLDSYMKMVKHKYPHVRNIFVSTETADVIRTLVRDYERYTFYFIDYPRQEKLSLRNSQNEFNYADEFAFSMANLYVAVHAQGFVGTLTSNWCSLIMEMERTRGDGGSDYMSLDHGSSMSVCF